MGTRLPHMVGIRHHSPACARLVTRLIASRQPTLVLIEGPCDFNPRLDELALPHTLPIALYSYVRDAQGMAQCWYPLLDYSPEWVALRTSHRIGAEVRFIDLPHWCYRTRDDAGEYVQRSNALRRRFGCDSEDALWDRLFESAPETELATRLRHYFDALRGSDPGSDADRLREDFMTRHIAAAVAQVGPEAVLVICGGWHLPALQAGVTERLADGSRPAPESPEPPADGDAGCYLVPYEFRQLEALSGYGAGMPSPLFYQWCWEDGAETAMERATTAIVQRLRTRKATLTTADFVVLQQAVTSLARLRGHDRPDRVDLLDGLLMAVVREALDEPPPWCGRGLLRPDHHPVLREALLALTGERCGRLDPATPHPPLVADAEATLARLDLTAPAHPPRDIVLDRRRVDAQARAETLWRLRLLGISGATLHAIRAPHAGRTLPETLRYQEHWQLSRGPRWYPDLIEAARYGPTLEQAAEQALLLRIEAAEGNAAALADSLGKAVRAGYRDPGTALSARLDELLPTLHDHGEVAACGLTLIELLQAGFWGAELLPLLHRPLAAVGERLLWLIDGLRTGSPGTLKHDVAAVACLAELLALPLPDFDPDFVRATLMRIARQRSGPPALRGAALGAAHEYGLASAEQLIALTRQVPPRDELGDFLFGLFSRTRTLATTDTVIVAAIQAALDTMPDEDFLIALPQLRGAFTWFPPRERGAIAARVAAVLGLSGSEHHRLLHLPGSAAALVDSKRIEARVLAWAEELGLRIEPPP